MKKILKVILKSVIGLIIIILILLFTLPVIFKKEIKAEVEKTINGSVNAKVTFTDYKLGFFRNFPNLSFSLINLSVANKGKFEGDTLAAFKSFDLVFNLGSLFSKSGYEVKSIIIDRAVINARSLKDGSANWDISKPSASATKQDSAINSAQPVSGSNSPQSSSGTLKVLLRRFEIRNSSISYSDAGMPMKAKIENLNFGLVGNFTLSGAGVNLKLNTGPVTVVMDSITYLNKAVLDAKINLLANLDSMKFTLKDNYFAVNDLRFHFSGLVAMPGKDIYTNLLFGTDQTSFKTLLSLIPAVYMKGYEDLKTSGNFALSGSVKGIYSDADSTLADVKINLNVNNGLVSYPALPEKISAININADVSVDGKKLDNTIINLDKFHFELAGNPFDMTFFLKTPISDPDFKGSLNGKLDLAALSKAVPMSNMKLSGLIEIAVSMAGKLSMIEKEQYDKFSASGDLGIKNMVIDMKGYPRIDIKEVGLQFTPAVTKLLKAELTVEKTSDFSITGSFGNYIPYIFRNETVKGNLSIRSNLTEANTIMKAMAEDTTATAVPDTVGLVLFIVPKKLDFDLNLQVEKLIYDNITADKFKGHILMHDGLVNIRETGLNILGGSVSLNADYDTRDTLKPVMKADLKVKDIGIKDAFNTFKIVQKFAPSAKGIEGKISVQLAYQSLLGHDMMPVMNTIDGSGRLQSDQVQLVESPVFDKMKSILKLGDNYSNTFKNIDISFKIKEGRVYVTPFDTKLGNIKMNIGGDQGLDQTLNYLVKTEIPRSDLGGSVNSLIDNLSAQAASFGIAIKPSEVLKINVKVSGTFSKPSVMPVFGNGSESGSTTTKKETVKETAKQIIENNIGPAKEKLRAEAEVEGDKLIKEAEEKGKQLHEEAVNAADKVKQEAAAQGQNLIKAAEPKGFLAKAAAQKSVDVLNKEAAKKADQMILEADNQAKKLVDEAKAKKEEMIKKI